MQKKKTVLILALVFVLLLGGASVLYQRLGAEAAPDQLTVQGAPAAEQEETAPPQKDAPQAEGADGPQEEPASAEGADASADAPDAEESQEPETPAAPDFTVYDVDGNAVRLSDYVGKPVVLNFWASWCGPCQIEMPDFDAAYAELGEEIHFLMVNMTDGFRETVEIASAFIEEKGYAFPVLYDTDSDAAMVYSVYSLPTTFFIGAQGELVAQATGAINRETLQKGIDLILAE